MMLYVSMKFHENILKGFHIKELTRNIIIFQTGVTTKLFCLFVLRFYGPVNPMGSCRARSVYLTTRVLGRFSPLSG